MEGSALSILTLLSAVPLSYPQPEKTPQSQHIQSRPLWALLKDDSDEIVRHYAAKVIRTYTYIPFADSVAPTAQPEITGFHTYSTRKILSTMTNRIYAVGRAHAYIVFGSVLLHHTFDATEERGHDAKTFGPACCLRSSRLHSSSQLLSQRSLRNFPS